MNIAKKAWAAIWAAFSLWRRNRVRAIPDSYFVSSYDTRQGRALALTRDDVQVADCTNCRHAAWGRSIRCTLEGDCRWQPCHVAAELSKADLRAGRQKSFYDGWMVVDASRLTERPKTGWARMSAGSGILSTLLRPTGISPGFFL